MNEEITRFVFRKLSVWLSWRVVALVAAFLLFPISSHALTLKQEALRGLKGVHVLVDEMDPEAKNMGLSTNQIKVDVELRLRKAGIKVLTKNEAFATPGTPALYVKTIVHVNSSSICTFLVQVELLEDVTLANGFEAFAAIWDTTIIGNGKISTFRGSIGDKVDEFINDYLAANPK